VGTRLGRKQLGALLAVSALVTGLGVATTQTATAAGSHAGYTSVDESQDGSGHCKNGNPDVNCNIYDGKQYVWMNGGPVGSQLGDGSYFFAVVAPSGQADPNDGSSDLLSTDPYTDRTFTVSGGVITYSGPHDADLPKIRLLPYADTPNPGGVYVMAICQMPLGVQPVTASDCKFDAFKVELPGSSTPTADPLTITKDATGSYNTTYTWTIDKSVDNSEIDTSSSATANYTVSVSHDAGTVGDVQVTGTISVFNPNVDSQDNPLPVDIDGVSDQLSDGTVCDVTDGGAQTLTQVQTDFAYTCDLSALPQGELDNTATVSYSEQFLDDGSLLSAASPQFTFDDVSFTGSDVDSCVDVSDTLEGTLGTVCVGDDNPTTYQYGITFNDPAGTCTEHDNTASFTGDDSGATDSASQSVLVCVGADLTVSKTAAPAFNRTYLWNVVKSVDKTSVSQGSGSATFNYTVVVSQTGTSDSGIQATGQITVTNPNDWESVTLTGVTDAVDNGGTCSFTGGDSTTSTIAPLGTATLNYKCTYASVPASGTNTATATWSASAAFTPHGSAHGTAAVTFGAPTSTTNKVITPTDTFNGGPATNLCVLDPSGPCTLTGADHTPFTTRTYHYSRMIALPAGGCAQYTNTAATGTGPTSSKTVTVCRLVAGALTIGYWQNKNGQGLITGDGSTSGVCNSVAFLRQYAPFQDLSSTATCKQVASYVNGVIGVASAAGAAMNAMLKAQMLATALDVYFSTPGLGGNKISAPTPLGGVKIDVTNASAAFGGSTCLSINQLLAYAASQSNVGGGTWYAQNKAVQGLAKDTFDSINNDNALTC
jgi:hypothetical protein